MLERYPQDVKIVFKHFPLGSHKFAANAALASVAAQEQGKFWQYHDLLFENYRTIDNEKLIEFAKKLDLNMPLFNKSMNSQEARDRVIEDHTNGREIGVSGTPAIYINGRLLRKKGIEDIQKIIDAELKQQQ